MTPRPCCTRRFHDGRWQACELRALHPDDHVWWDAATGPAPRENEDEG